MERSRQTNQTDETKTRVFALEFLQALDLRRLTFEFDGTLANA
jgi:hypothetical protein